MRLLYIARKHQPRCALRGGEPGSAEGRQGRGPSLAGPPSPCHNARAIPARSPGQGANRPPRPSAGIPCARSIAAGPGHRAEQGGQAPRRRSAEESLAYIPTCEHERLARTAATRGGTDYSWRRRKRPRGWTRTTPARSNELRTRSPLLSRVVGSGASWPQKALIRAQRRPVQRRQPPRVGHA